MPVADPDVGVATDSASTLITALELEKDEPSPEGEILRGVHDHKTVYTLTLRNNEVHPTSGITLEDWLPAGLEYLALRDRRQHAPGPVEYPGAPALDADRARRAALRRPDARSRR